MDRPPSADKQNIRGILFEWVEGQPISTVCITSQIVDQLRASHEALHHAGIAHNDLRANNILVEAQDVNPKAYLIDLSASITLPHVKFPPQDLNKLQQDDIRNLDVGFALLSQIPINQGLCTAKQPSSAAGSLDHVIAASQHRKHLWERPRPSCFQSTA